MGFITERKWILNACVVFALTVPMFLVVVYTDKDGGKNAYSVISTPTPPSAPAPTSASQEVAPSSSRKQSQAVKRTPEAAGTGGGGGVEADPTGGESGPGGDDNVDVAALLKEEKGGKGKKISPERQAYLDKIFTHVHPGQEGPGPDMKNNDANNLPRGMNPPPATPDLPHNIASTAETRAFFQKTLFILMLSPPRYQFARETYDHYAPFFEHIHVCGPKKNDTTEIELQGLKVHLYDIVYGNEQYRATSRIIKQYEESADQADRNKFEGYLYCADDLMLHPWALAGQGRKNKTIPWAGSMGMANVLSAKPLVTAIPAMSIEPQFRNMPWPYWRKNKVKLLRALMEGGPRMRKVLRMSGLSTHPYVIMKSKYNMRHYNLEHLEFSVYFTIVDTYYVPKHLSLPLAHYFDLMAKHWVFGECAIATALRAVSPIYQEMSLQFYWSIGTAVGCPRAKWHAGIDGFHRCHHNHPFARLIYSELGRAALRDNSTFWRQSTKLKYNDSTPSAPSTPSPYLLN